MRDYTNAALLLQCADDFHMTAEDVELLTGYSANTVRQRRLRNFPHPVGQGRLLRWRLGDVRAWLASPNATCEPDRPRRSRVSIGILSARLMGAT